MTVLSMSSYSVREHLGPLEFSFTDALGEARTFSFDHESLTTLADFPRRARDEFGVEAIETVAFQFRGGLDDPELDAFAAALASTGVRLLNVAVDAGDLLDPDDERRTADIAELARWIRRFGAMGSSFVRVNPGSPFSQHPGGALPPAHLVTALRKLGDVAADHGTRLLVENHGGASSDPAWMLALLSEVGEQRLGLLLDLGNFDTLLNAAGQLVFRAPGAPELDAATVLDGADLGPVYAGIEQLAPRAELVHVKVHDVDDDGTIRAIDLDRAIAILREHGYDRALTIEYEGTGGDPWAKSALVLEATRRAVGARA